MKNRINKNKDLKYYLNLPWEYIVEPCEQGGFYIRVNNLKCYSHGNNMEEAYQNIREALELHLEGFIEEGVKIEEPINELDCTGSIHIRTKKSMHKKLKNISKIEEVSVSHLINDALVKTYG